MKSPLAPALCFAILASWGGAAGPVPDPAASDRLSMEQVEVLVSPIALYPDPLVALILPAATRPSDIVLAARFLERGGNPDDTGAQPWETSVKSLVRYGEVITYLDENLAWTQSLGECFLEQPEDIMAAIQILRARARSAGLLTDTAEQEIVVEEEEIRIVPARPTVIYVPRYDPEVLYVSYSQPYYGGPFLVFGLGYSVGAWLSYDCDWHHRTVLIGHRPVGWHHRPDWRVRHVRAGGDWRPWTPAPHHRRHYDRPTRPRGTVVLRPNREWESTRQSRLANTPRSPDHGRSPNWQQRDGNRDRSQAAPDRSNRPDPSDRRREPRPNREANSSALIGPPSAAPSATATLAPALNAPRHPPGNTPRRHTVDHSSRPARDHRSRPDASTAASAPAPSRATVGPRPAASPTRTVTTDRPARTERTETSGRPSRPDKPGDRNNPRDPD